MKDRFFSKLDWAAFWTATLVTFAVYFFTLGPSVGLEDSGELATAAAHLGVPHPPGYPIWTLFAWLFCKLFCWVTYMGHPTPAWAVSCFSATAGAFAAGCTAMLICRSARDFITPGMGETAVFVRFKNLTREGLLAFAGGVAGALTFALSPVEWSQSTIVEVYSLNALFLMWVFLLSYRWMRKPSDKILWLTAFIFGLGLTNYQVLVFAIVPLALIILMRNFGMFRDVFIYLVPVALTYQILQIGSLQAASYTKQNNVIAKHAAVLSTTACPSSTMIALGLVVLVGSICAAVVLQRRALHQKAREAALYGGGAAVALLVLSATLFTGKTEWSGVSLDIAPLIEPWRYVLIAALVAGSAIAALLAALEDDDLTVLRLEAQETGVLPKLRALLPAPGGRSAKLLGIAAVLALAAIVLAASVPQAGLNGYAGPAYPWAKSTRVFWALIVVLFALCSFTRKGLCFAIPVAGLQIAAFLLLRHGAMNGLTHPASWWFGWPVAWNFVLLALAWATLPNGLSLVGAAFFTCLGVSFYVYMPIVSDLRNPPMNWGFPRTWDGFKHALQRGQYEAIGIPDFKSILDLFAFLGSQMWHYCKDVMLQFTDVFVPFVFVPFIAGRWIVCKAQKRTFWQWMAAAASCFLMMSLLLMLLANVKGDVQDGFIQKVKFISSHAMIALWIGYGLVFAGALGLKACRYAETRGWALAKKPGVFVVSFSALVLVIALVFPIVQNYTDERMVFELGGSEQNGHTFGWQFGAYQLDGAKAIEQQLVADEEPLPDPGWPPPMSPSAIFFGGTDPGRFVPTYMIYSANFRPDIYLITQNALADETYMQVERDLYGDEIWIPAKEDSSDAFGIYIDEVHRGVRRANGDLKIENERVQVTGALGVMEINGILTEMMWRHDRLRHDFYVEESYAIKWMYPYLSPHGLIMKLNRDKTPYDAARAAKDCDFWDWYTRRLLKDPMFRRDFAGQKSFSKLRAALAGLYASQGRRAEAAQAFRESVLLYPASPEAVFRYAQSSLLTARRWDIALELMDYTDAIDPNNTRTARVREAVGYLRSLFGIADKIEDQRRRGQALSRQDTFTLGHAYFNIGSVYKGLNFDDGLGYVMRAAQVVRTLVDAIADPRALKSIAEILVEAELNADAEKCLTKLTTLRPDDGAEPWLQLAKLQYKSDRKQAARRSFEAALALDRGKVLESIQKDQLVYEIAVMSRARPRR